MELHARLRAIDRPVSDLSKQCQGLEFKTMGRRLRGMHVSQLSHRNVPQPQPFLPVARPTKPPRHHRIVLNSPIGTAGAGIRRSWVAANKERAYAFVPLAPDGIRSSPQRRCLVWKKGPPFEVKESLSLSFPKAVRISAHVLNKSSQWKSSVELFLPFMVAKRMDAFST